MDAVMRPPDSGLAPSPNVATPSVPGHPLGGYEVEALAGVPERPLVPVRRNAARVSQGARRVHEVPGHEGGVAVGEVVFGSAGSGIQVGRTRARLTQPGGVGLRRDGVTEMLE